MRKAFVQLLLLELSSVNDCQKNKPSGKPSELGDFGKIEILSSLILSAYKNPEVDFKLDVVTDLNGFYHIRSFQEISLTENYCQIVNGRDGFEIKTIYFSFNKEGKLIARK